MNMVDKFKDECGVFGIFGHTEASNLTYLGLYALQHRGQESAGIAAADGTQIRVSKAMGYVNEAFDSATLDRLPGTTAVGHVRYSTAGEVLERVRFPVSNITKIAFGGSDHRTAFATTARHLLNDEKLVRQPLAGALFAFPVGVAGIPCPLVAD